MAAGSIVSRLTGFGRNVVIGGALGGAVLGNSYTTAQYFPQMLYEMVLGGILTSVVVPLIVRAGKTDADGGAAFTHRLLTLSILLLAGATACVVAAAPWIAQLMTDANRELVTSLSYFMLPAVFFYGLSALMQAVLNTHDHFAAPMWAPILNNVVIIVVGVVFFAMYTSNAATAQSVVDGAVTPDMILVLGLGTLAGIVTQSVALIPVLRKVGFRWRWRFDFRGLPLGEVGRLGGWILFYVGLNQVAMVVIIKVANAAFDKATPGVVTPGPIIYNNAYLVMMMAHGIIAVSIITALMPRLSAAASEGRLGDVAANLSSGLRLSTLGLAPVTVVYIVLGTPVAVLLFNVANFTEAEAQATGPVIAVAGLVLIPFAISQLQTFAFYAMTDGRTVALINIPVVAVRIGASFAALAWLPPEHVVMGLMIANGLSYVVTVIFSTALLRRRVGRLGMGEVVSTWVRQAIAAGVAGVAVWFVLGLLPDVGADKILLVAQLAGLGALVVLVYVIVAFALRVQETTDMARMVKSKLGR